MEAAEKIYGVDGGRYTLDSSEHRAYVQRWDAAYMKVHAPELAKLQGRLQRFDALHDRIRTDANMSAFLARQLLFMRGTVERKVYERVRIREFVPVETHPRGAASYATQLLDMQGEAKVTHDLAGDDPRADVSVTEDLGKYINIRGAYGLSLQELEHAAFAGVPLPAWKAEACVDMISRGTDKVGRIGDALSGLTGFFNNANVNTVTLTNGEWLTATAAEILADLAQIEQAIISQAKDAQPQVGYRLVLPTAYEGRLATLEKSSGSDLTVKEFFLKNARLITSIERYIALDSASGTDTGVADDPEGICYPMEPGTLFWPVAISYEELAAQQDGWEWVVRARARVGGVEFRRPFNAVYVENLD